MTEIALQAAGTGTDRPALALPTEMAAGLPDAVRDALARMPVERQGAFLEAYQHEAKGLAMAYLCSLIYGHYILLGRWWMSVWLLLSLPVSITLGYIWWLIDLVRMPEMVRTYNQQLAAEIVRRLDSAPAD